ncbi:MAG TPA: Adventurous gliding motility protein K [Myxococcales bacterium]|nr:Adventurous gliding motility protein K [Myxococcales bacterium]
MTELEKNLVPDDIDIDLAEPAAPQRSTPRLEVAVELARAALDFPPPDGEPLVPSEAEVRELIAVYEREARALGNDAGAAVLHYEMGLLWNEHLKNARNAAVCFQNAYRLAPKLVPNIQAARRLFGEVGNWQMAAQLLDAEAAAARSESERVALMVEKAAVLEDKLGRSDEAFAILEQCLERAPGDIGVLSALESAYAARGDTARLKDVFLRLAEAIADPGLKCHYLISAAQLCEGPLSQPSEASELYRRAFELQRRDPGVLSAIKRSAEREGRPEEMLAALRAEAEGGGASSAPIFFRISRVHERMGHPDAALAALEAGRKISPHDPIILDELARVYEVACRWEELAGVLRARVEKLTDAAELIALNLRLGALSEEKLGDEEAAIACYRKVLEVSPSHPSAVACLGKLYHRKQSWEELLEVLAAEIEATEDPRQKVSRLYKAAELLEVNLSRDAEAVTCYRQILDLQPDYLPAQKALIRIFERNAQWDELVALHEHDLRHTQNRDQIVSVLTHIASIHEERRGDTDSAIATLQRVLEVVADHLPTLRNLARLCERADRWEELLRINETEASLASDAKEMISLLHTNAEIFEEKLKDRDRAIATYQKLLGLSATYLPALKALGKLYAQSGQWEKLVDMYRQEAEMTPSPEQAAGLIFKAGELLEEKLDRLDDAIGAYQEVLTLSPDHFPAMRALSRIYRERKDWEYLVDTLRAEAAARSDCDERANTLFQVASLWEDEMSRTDLAIETYLEALALVPAHMPAFRALERLYGAQGAFKDLVSLHQRELEVSEPPEAKVAVLEKLAVLWSDHLADSAQAGGCYEQILALQPNHLMALKKLETLHPDKARRAEIRARIAEALSDARAAASMHLAALRDREAAGLQAEVSELRRAAELTPDDPRVAGAYERVLRQSGDWTNLAVWLERRVAGGAPESLGALRLRLGEVYEWRLGHLERALGCYRAVLETEPAHLAALAAARRLLVRRGEHAEVFKLLTSEGRAARDATTAIAAFLAAGRLAEEQLQDVSAARAAYQEVLARDPLDKQAGERLESLLALSGGGEQIAELHLNRARSRAGSGDQAGAAEEYLSAAKVFANQVKDGQQALEALDQALALAPDSAPALLLYGELCLAANRHAEAAQAFYRRIELGGDPRELAALHHRLGALLQDHLGDPGRATAHLQTALSVDPRNLDALERLGTIHLATRNWSGAADAYRRLVEADPDPKRLSRHLATFACIAEEGFGEHAAAATHYKRALDLAPSDAAIMDKLAGLYERLGKLDELSGLLEKQAIDAAAAGDRPRALTLRMRSGELWARQGDRIKAVQNYRFAVELSPESVPARAALADLLAKDPGAAPAAIEEHRNLLKVDPFRLESYHILYRLYANSRQLDRAVCAGHVLSFCKALTEAEVASFSEARGRVPQDTTEVLGADQLDLVLQHPSARHPLSDIMRAIGDQLHKLVDPGLDVLGVGRSDRLKPDNALYRAVKAPCSAFGIDKFDVYLSKRGAQLSLVNTDPLAIVIGSEFVRRYNQREQKFLLARAAFNLRNKMALAQKLEAGRLADLIGNAVRIALPEFDRLGTPDPETSKKIKKAMSGKALKLLEPAARELAESKSIDLKAWLQACNWSADRAGLLLAGDISAALQLMLREDPSITGVRLDSPEQIVAALRKRRDMFEVVAFILSDDHLKLRTRLRLSLA